MARVAAGKTVNPNVYAMILPGSGLVKQQAEAEGLDKIFKAAGFDWREPGCSICLAMKIPTSSSRARAAPRLRTAISRAAKAIAAVRIWSHRRWRRRRRLRASSSTCATGINENPDAKGPA